MQHNEHHCAVQRQFSGTMAKDKPLALSRDCWDCQQTLQNRFRNKATPQLEIIVGWDFWTRLQDFVENYFECHQQVALEPASRKWSLEKKHHALLCRSSTAYRSRKYVIAKHTQEFLGQRQFLLDSYISSEQFFIIVRWFHRGWQ